MNLTPDQVSAIMALLIPGAAACLLPLAAIDKDQATQKWIRAAMFFIALFALMGCFFYVTSLWGKGAQPSFGPVRFDRLAQFATIFILITAALAVLQLWDHLHLEGWVKGETLSLLMFSVTGMILFCSSSNLMVLFLGLELLSIPLYALTGTLRQNHEALEGGVKYFITGAVASSCFLMGAVLLYGMTGTLDAAVMASIMPRLGSDPVMLIGVALLLLGFLFKVSAVPFHQWTPDVYEAAPHPISGFMSVATKGAALFALIRIFPAALLRQEGILQGKVQAALILVAVLSLILGNLTALTQTNVKRMLAYSSISHAGYLILGLVAGTSQAFIGMGFYLVSYLAMNMGAFGLLTALGLAGDRTGYDDLRGMGWKRPELGFAAILCMFSLAGIPPTGGFYGKYMIFRELVAQGHVSLAVLGVLASLVSVAYYLRVVVALFLEKPLGATAGTDKPHRVASLASGTVLVCGLLVMLIGIFPSLLSSAFAQRAVQESLNLLK
ncbi:MAG: proton-translocating NADH-quinone oxidoreductase, chain [Holophagaceae bacterium]|nr:proton-translocating NADH-quinone oxidoreductase, chain [Holophagaceae bacterium]